MATRVNPKSIQELELIGRGNKGLDLCQKHEDKLCAVIAQRVDNLFDLSRFKDRLDELDDLEGAHFSIRLTQTKIFVTLEDGNGYSGGTQSFTLPQSARKILREADRLYHKCQQEKYKSSGRDRFSPSLSRRHMSPLPTSTGHREDRHADSFGTSTRGTRTRSAERDRRLSSSHLSLPRSKKLESEKRGSSSSAESSPKSTAAKREDKRRVSSSTESSPIATSTTSTRKRETSESPSFSPTQSPFKDSPLSDRSPEGTVRELSFNLYNLQNRLSTLRNSPKPTRTESREITALKKEIRQLRHEIAELKGLVENPHAAQFGHADFGSFPQTTASTYTDGRHFSPLRNADFRPSFSMEAEAPATHLNNENAQLKARIQELKISSENAQLKTELEELEKREEERLQPTMKEKETKALIEKQAEFKLETSFLDNEPAPLELPPQPEEKKRWWHNDNLSPTTRERIEERFGPMWEEWERRRELRIQTLRTKIEAEKRETEQKEKNKKLDEKRKRDEANRAKDEKLREQHQAWDAHLRSVKEHNTNPAKRLEQAAKKEARETSRQEYLGRSAAKVDAAREKEQAKKREKADELRAQEPMETYAQTLERKKQEHKDRLQAARERGEASHIQTAHAHIAAN